MMTPALGSPSSRHQTGVHTDKGVVNLMSQSRTRIAAVAGSLALSLSLVAAPIAFAQDGPEATVENLMAAIEAKDFEALPTFFCPEFAGSMGGLDLSAMAEGMPEGVDVDALLDALILDTELASVEVVSQTDAEAVVKLQGSMSMDIDADAMGPFIESMGPFIESMMESNGMEVTPETVEMFTGLIMSQLMSSFEPEVTDIDAEITMVPGEDGTWLVCSDLAALGGGTADGSMAPDESMAPVESMAPEGE